MTLYSAYKKQLSISSNIDLQTIYDADVDSGDAVITTNTTDGSVVIAGSASLSVTATNGVSITNALTLSNKTSGSVLFAGAAGLVQQDNANLFWDDTNNLLGIGNSAPVALFSVGSTSQFRVDSSGNILRINDVVTSFPASQGAASTFLQNNGSGVLTWVSVGASPTAVVTLSAAQLAAQTSVEIVLSPSVGQYLLPTEVEALFTYGTALGAGDVTLKYSNQTLSTLTNLLSNTVTKQVAQNVPSLTPENSALYVKAALGFLTAAFGGNNSQYTSIAIDSANVPYVAFSDGDNNNTPTVYKLVSGTWTLVGLAFGNNSQYTSIAIDSANVPYVAFSDGDNDNKSTVYKFVSGTWNQVGAAFGGFGSQYTSIAIDSADVPYVAFQDFLNGKPTVYKFVSGTWTLVGLAFGGINSSYTSIAIDSADVPYVAFNDGNNNNKSTVYKFVSGTWTLVGAAFGGNNSNFTSIAIDSADVPYVAFKDGGNNGKPTVYKLVLGTWTLVGAAFGGIFSNYTSIAIDSADVPYVAFNDGNNNNKSTVYKFDGVAWNQVGLAFGGNSSQYTSIAIDSAGAPYVAFNDGGNGGKPTVAALTAPAGATVKLRVHYQVLSLLT